MKTLVFTCALLLVTATLSNVAEAQKKKDAKPYEEMDYGPFLSATFVAGKENVAYRGVAVPFTLPDGGKAGVIFDSEMLRYMVVWQGGFIKYDGVVFNGNHGSNPGPQGTTLFTTKATPGWAKNGDLKDPRDKVKDPREMKKSDFACGPLPRDWGRYKGLYRSDAGVLFKYTVGALEVLDMPALEVHDGEVFFCRTVRVPPTDRPLTLVVTDVDGGTFAEVGKTALIHKGNNDVVAAVVGGLAGPKLEVREASRLVLNLPASSNSNTFKVCLWTGSNAKTAKATATFARIGLPADLSQLTAGGKARYTQTVTTEGKRGDDKTAYTLDTIKVPFDNPYKSWMRLGGVDFFSDGRAAVSTWSGDVWIVSGLDDKLDKVTWKRFASGLFQPLGLKIVDDVIHVIGRDGVMKLHDLNGDGECDYYECYNNDFLVTSNFHEFIFDLHTDSKGNFYFVKAGPVRPGGRGWDTITPSHGSLFKLSKDGQKLEVIARGFRAPNGMGVGPNDEITTGDNEGTWTPQCPINWIKPGGFYGVPEFSQRSPLPTMRDNPLCWLPHKGIDNSSGCQVWITGKNFGPLSGQMLHLSYGTCTLFNVMKEEVGGQMQGGVVAIPLKFDTGIMRARFVDKQNALYLAGLSGWQTTGTKPGGFYRVRYTGKAANLPVGLNVAPATVKLTFSEPLNKKSAEDTDNYALQRWNYRWTETYGSPEFKVSDPKQQGHDDMEVESASLSPDGKTVTLKVTDLKPVMQMKIAYQLKSADGAAVKSTVYHTINVVGDMRGEVHVGEYRIVTKK